MIGHTEDPQRLRVISRAQRENEFLSGSLRLALVWNVPETGAAPALLTASLKLRHFTREMRHLFCHSLCKAGLFLGFFYRAKLEFG